MKIDADDLPVTPIVWNGRLLVFWLKVIKQSPPASPGSPPATPQSGKPSTVASLSFDQLQYSARTSATAPTPVNVSAALCFSEYYNGKWQPTKTSDVNLPTMIRSYPAGDNSFEAQRSWLRLAPTELAGDMAGALLISIESPLDGTIAGGFVLYNTHSLPIRVEDIDPTLPSDSNLAGDRALYPVLPYTGGAIYRKGAYHILGVDLNFQVQYQSAFWLEGSPYQTNDILTPTLIPRYVVPQDGSAGAWDAPFFYEDRQNVFYVTTSESIVPVWNFGGYGLGYTTPGLIGSVVNIPPVVQPQAGLQATGEVVALGTVSKGGDLLAIQQLVGTDPNIHIALGSTSVVTFGGQAIGAKGSRPIALQASAERSA